MQSFRKAPKRKRHLLLIILCCFFASASAQERCGAIPADPVIFEPWMQQKISSREKLITQGQKPPVYEIPIVVHIIEPASGGSLNITNARVERQIEILNEDFRRTNADAINTPTEFVPVAADTEIQFVLAKQDPLGRPTNGIVRVRGSRDVYSATIQQDLIRSESYWPPENYLNMHVLNLQVFLGWSSFPFTSIPGINNSTDDSVWDGVLVDAEYFGENPSASSFPSFGRTATHEIGHYLGLRHIWGDGGCGVDDFVSDTPEADTNNGGLSAPCTFPNDDPTVCVTDEMFQNYMDYTDDGCMNLFTLGQRDRMRTVLENSPRRTTLTSSPALLDPILFSNDLTITRILTPSPFECASSSFIPNVEVTNHGDNEITSYELTLLLDGSTTEVKNVISTLGSKESESVFFNSLSTAVSPTTVEFRIGNVNGSPDGSSSNNTKSINLLSQSQLAVPFLENSESSPKIAIPTGGTSPWEVVQAPKETVPNNALVFKSFQNTSAFGEATWLKTPVFDLTGINSAELSFSYAYAPTSDSFWDGLGVKISQDCGESFSDDFIFNSYGPELATSTETELSFVPADQTDWKDTTINITGIISQFSNRDAIQFAFIGQNGGGNNIYVDDIAVTQTNINANDISLTEIGATLLTCGEDASATFTTRNVGFEEITRLTYEYTIGGNTITETRDNLSVLSGEFQPFIIDLDLAPGANQLDLSIIEVNGLADDDITDNSLNISISRDSRRDSYPLIVDFETSNSWVALSPNSSQLWSKTTAGSNDVLVANAFTNTTIGAESWFISPSLDVGLLDTAGLAFKASYAKREGFNDQLQVLMSINCGETYDFELLTANSDSLAITQSNSSWFPGSDADWKEFKIDLKSSIPWKDDIRLAFVFTNGNGNNLYLDDINIGFKPTFINQNAFRIFPNPATSRFNIAFTLEARDDIQIQIMDIAGKIVFTSQYENVLDQVYDFDVLSQDGFYFVKITGDRINQTERMYIRR